MWKQALTRGWPSSLPNVQDFVSSSQPPYAAGTNVIPVLRTARPSYRAGKSLAQGRTACREVNIQTQVRRVPASGAQAPASWGGVDRARRHTGPELHGQGGEAAEPDMHFISLRTWEGG